MKIILILMIMTSTLSVANAKVNPNNSANKKVIYKYKSYEKFDFDEMNISGDSSNPGDLSINPRFKKEYKNYLPSKPNFNREFRRSILSLK